MWVWSRTVPSAEAETWPSLHLDEEMATRTVVTAVPGKKSVRIEIYATSRAELSALPKQAGGKLSKTPPLSWWLSRKRDFYLRVPPWFSIGSEPRPGQELPHLVIPSGPAFGTGEHATTALCVRQLARLCAGSTGSLLDAGTGSGILALVASFLGWKVTGLEPDPMALEEARRNGRRNRSVPRVRWVEGSVETFRDEAVYDGVAANLYAECLIGNMERLRARLRTGGWAVFSGILHTQEAGVVRVARRNGFRLRRRLRKGKWICLVLDAAGPDQSPSRKLRGERPVARRTRRER